MRQGSDLYRYFCGMYRYTFGKDLFKIPFFFSKAKSRRQRERERRATMGCCFSKEEDHFDGKEALLPKGKHTYVIPGALRFRTVALYGLDASW